MMIIDRSYLGLLSNVEFKAIKIIHYRKLLQDHFQTKAFSFLNSFVRLQVSFAVGIGIATFEILRISVIDWEKKIFLKKLSTNLVLIEFSTSLHIFSNKEKYEHKIRISRFCI